MAINWDEFTPVAAPKGDVDKLVKAITHVESGGNTEATSPQGARGSMQIMPATFKQYARPGESYDDDADRRSAATRKIADDLAYYGGDTAKAAAAYIGGRGAVKADGTIRGDVADKLGTTPAKYAQMVTARMGKSPDVNWDDFKPVESDKPAVNWDEFKPVAAEEKPGFIASAMDGVKKLADNNTPALRGAATDQSLYDPTGTIPQEVVGAQPKAAEAAIAAAKANKIQPSNFDAFVKGFMSSERPLASPLRIQDAITAAAAQERNAKDKWSVLDGYTPDEGYNEAQLNAESQLPRIRAEQDKRLADAKGGRLEPQTGTITPTGGAGQAAANIPGNLARSVGGTALKALAIAPDALPAIYPEGAAQQLRSAAGRMDKGTRSANLGVSDQPLFKTGTAAIDALIPSARDISQYVPEGIKQMGEYAAMGPMGIIADAGVQGYDKSRVDGLSVGMSALAGTAQALTEGVPEALASKFAIHALDKVPMRAILSGDAKVLTQAIQQSTKAMGVEVSSELVSSLGNWYADRVFADPTATPERLKSDLIDAFKATLIQGPTMIAGGKVLQSVGNMAAARPATATHTDPLASAAPIMQAQSVDEAAVLADKATRTTSGASAVDAIDNILKNDLTAIRPLRETTSNTPLVTPVESVQPTPDAVNVQNPAPRQNAEDQAAPGQAPAAAQPAVAEPTTTRTDAGIAPAQADGLTVDNDKPVAQTPADEQSALGRVVNNDAGISSSAKSQEQANTGADGRNSEATGNGTAQSVGGENVAGNNARIQSTDFQGTATLKPNGTLDIQGDPAAITAQLKAAGFTGIKTKTGVQVGKSQAVEAQAVFQQNQSNDQSGQLQTAIESVAPNPQQLGRNNTPISEGGKPFKTKLAAAEAKKLQPMMRVVKSGDGYVLTEKTAKQLEAEKKSAQRLRNPQTSTKGEPIPAHSFIASEGGLHANTRSDMGMEGNVRVGNRSLFAGAGKGLTIERATERLKEEGYLRESDSHDEARNLIKRSLTNPQYTPEGFERLAESETSARFEDHLAAEKESVQNKPDWLDEFIQEEANFAGYEDLDAPLRMQVDALLSQANAIGINTEDITNDAEENTYGKPASDYLATVRDSLTHAIEKSARSSRDQSDNNQNPEQGRQDAQRESGDRGGKDAGKQGDSGANAKAVEQIRTADLSYNTTKRLAAAYRGEKYRGVSEDYKTIRADLEARAADVNFKDRALAQDALERFDESIANQKLRGQDGLTAPSKQDILKQQERAKATEKADAKSKAEQDKKDRIARERKDIASRQEASAENYKLGQSAEDSLSGQASFSRAPQTDSAAFKAWFGKSVVVNEDGSPKVMYHGTDQSFDAFSKEKVKSRFPYSFGLHFTDGQDEASIYADSLTNYAEGFNSASKFAKPVTEGGNVMPVYLKAEHPLVINTDMMSASMEADINRYDIMHKLVAARDAGKPYDSVIIKRERGDEYDGQNIIVFKPEQVKSAIGNSGTFDPKNPDIRYSRKDEAKDLIIQHNMTAENLLHADRMGGMAVPSLAIVKADAPLKNFGEITLIGDRNMADPKQGIKAYGADIYSPRYPDISYKADRDVNRKLNEKLAAFQGQDRPIYEVRQLDDLTQNNAFKRYVADKTGKAEDSIRWDDLKSEATAMLRSVGAQEQLFQGFSNNGNRRYKPHTIENVIAILKKELRGGENFNYGAGSLRAKFTPQFRSIEAIKAAKGTLVSKEQFEAIRDEVNTELIDIADALNTRTDTAIAIFEDAPKMGLKRAAAQYQIELGDEMGQRMARFMTRLKNMPTEYFEGKMLRAVGIGEFKAAVVPSDSTDDVLNTLKREGVQTFTYQTGDEADRTRAIKEAANAVPDGVFKRGEEAQPGLSSAQIKQQLAPTLSRLTVPYSVHTIAQAEKETLIEIPPGAKGMFFRGKLHLFSDTIQSPLEAEAVFFHEALHAGLDAMYGGRSKEYHSALMDISLKNKNVREAAKKWLATHGQSDIAAMVKAGASKEVAERRARYQAIDEALAELSGANAQISGIKKFIAKVQAIMRAIGLNRLADAIENKTDAEAMSLIIRARNAVMSETGAHVDSDGLAAFARGPQDNQQAIQTPPQPRPRTPLKWRDATGRLQFAPGQAAYDLLGDAAGPLLNKLRLKAASPELRRQLRQMKIDVEKAQEKTVAIAKETAKLSQDERDMVSDLIEQEMKVGVIPPAHALKLSVLINDAMGEQTDELERLGMLAKDAGDKWRGKYLPRFYKSKLKLPVPDAWADALGKMTGRTPVMKGVRGNHLKSRGLYETIPEVDLKNYESMGWEVRDPDYTPGLPAVDGTVQVWRDFSRQERDKMGEIRDSGFRFVMGYMQTQRDIALGRMFERIAQDPMLSTRLAQDGFTVQVPKTVIEGTGAKRYGLLAGRFVAPETLSQLSNIEENQSEAWQMYRKAMGLWKEGKTALNPVSHVNNIVSNLTMAHLAGVGYHRADKYIAAIKDFAVKSPLLLEAKEAGLFLGTMSEAELMNTLPDELKLLVREQESKGALVGRSAMNLMTFFLRKPMGAAYQAEDTFFRYLIWKDAKEHGMDAQDAVDYAQKYIFTYDDLPKGARRIRDFAIPFFSYTYKAAPILLHTAMTHPLRMAAPAGLLWAVNAASYAIAGGDDDDSWTESLKKYLQDPEFRAKVKAKEKLEREFLPPWMKGTTALLTPKTLRLGMDELTKLPLFIDISRLIPGGDLFDVSPNAGGLPIPQPVTPSHPLFTTAVAMLGNKDLFFGKEIVDGNDTTAEAATKRGAWLWKQLTPAIAAGNYHWERGMNALAQATGSEVTWMPDILGGDATGIGRDGNPVQPKYAAMQTFGIKVRPIDLDTSQQIDKSLREKMVKDIDAEIRKLRRYGNKGALPDRVVDKEIDLAREKKQRLRDGLTVDGNEKP